MPPQIKQAKLETLEAIIKEVKGMIVNTPEKVAELNKDLPSTIQEEAYLKALGYKEAVDDLLLTLVEMSDAEWEEIMLTKLQAEKELIDNN